MGEKYEAVHVHCIDERGVIEEYRQRGFILKERTAPTIIAQMGFVKLIFVASERVEAEQSASAYLG
jgi:hypothetical protein